MIKTQQHPLRAQHLAGKTNKRQVVESVHKSLWQTCSLYVAGVEKAPKGRRLSLDVKTK